MGAVTTATRDAFDLAEGPVWDPVRQKLLWVDIRLGAVLVGTLHDDGTISVDERVETPGMVGAVAVSDAGDWILAGERKILTRSAAGRWSVGPTVLDSASGRRLNDGKIDPAGRFVVGTLKIDESETHEERLVMVESDGALRDLDDDLTLANGLAWTPDGRTLYGIDTVRQVVNVRDYDARTGTAGPRRMLVQIEGDVYPDGMCLDADGFLWVAIWNGGEVRRYAPDGALDRTIDIPAPQVSCVAFAGPDLATLVVTTASKQLSAEQLAASPLSGHLFTVDAGVRGVPLTPWSGELVTS